MPSVGRRLAGPRAPRDNGWIRATAPAEGGTMATATMRIADLLESLGGIPAHRVLLYPAPGTATERDLIELHERDGRLYELVDGTLVEKPMGFDESRVAALLVGNLLGFLERHDLGAV